MSDKALASREEQLLLIGWDTFQRINSSHPYLAFSDFLFSPPINTPGTIQVNGYRKTADRNQRKAPLPVHVCVHTCARAQSLSSLNSSSRASQARGMCWSRPFLYTNSLWALYAQVKALT